MAASVVTSSVASHNASPNPHEVALVPYWGTVEVATTSLDEAGDDVLLYLFPAGTYIPNDPIALRVETDDLDSGGTPALVVDFGIGDSDGVIDTVLINDSTIGQAGSAGAVATAVSASGPYLDVGGKYLIMTVVTAAATAAAGTVEFGGVFASRGLEQLS